jgi:hypothetical protein
MAVLQQKNAQQFNIGQLVEFIGYDGDATGELEVGDQLKITGFDPDNQLYNVVRESDGHEDSLFDVEFSALEEQDEEQKPVAEKPVSKRGRPKKVVQPVSEDEDEEKHDDEEDEEAPKAKASKKLAKDVKPQKPSAKKATVEVEGDDEEDDVVEEEESVEQLKAKGRKQNLKKEVVKEVEDEEQDEDEEVKPKQKKVKTKVEQEEDSDSEGEPLATFVQTESVSEILSLHGSELKAAIALAEEKERTIFTLGGVLAKIKRYDTFRSIENKDGEPTYEKGLKGFNLYVKAELGVEPRSAAYYVDLYEMFSQVTTEEKISKIGWTKLRELLPLREVITEKNVDGWLKKAKSTTTKELHDEVTKHLVDAGEKVHGNKQLAEQSTYKFVVHSDQANTVQDAIAKAKDIIGDDASDGAALVHILSEWLQMSDSE